MKMKLKFRDSRKTPVLLWEVLSKKERQSLFGVFALLLLGSFLELVSVGLMLPVLEAVSGDSSSFTFLFFTVDSSLSKETVILFAFGSLFIIYLLKNTFLVLSTWLQRGLFARITTRLSSKMLDVYLQQKYMFHLNHNSSKLIRNTQDVSSFTGSGIEPMIAIFSDGLTSIVLFGLLMVIEPLGTTVTIVVMLFAFKVLQYFSDRKLQNWGLQRQIEKGAIIEVIQQSLGSVKELQVLGRTNWFSEEHAERQRFDAWLQRRIKTYQSIPRLWLEVVAVCGLFVLVATMVSVGKDTESIIPTLGIFVVTAFRVLPSVNKLVSGLQTLKVSRSTIETIHRDIGLPVDQNRCDVDVNFLFKSLVARQMSFKYSQTDHPVLIGINVEVLSGEAVGFVGQSGSGKSTLIDIMLGLLEPQSGSVLINGQSLENVKQSWQKQIGYIPQTIFLMDDSLRRNIALGIADNEIDEVAIVEALKSAQLEDFVASLPEGLDTVVGERGVRLSGGQRQRIGIARALYHQPSVLVLDEATSSLDTETEKGVMQAVQALQGDKTVIIVAHRLSTVEYCDRLYRLDAGRIVDEGTFDEVMNRSQS
jgi:ATP-binding cassette, subfamily B, bacterial PglK